MKWVDWPYKVMRYAVLELVGIAAFLVEQWPNTALGFALRKFYWGRKTGLRNLMIWRGVHLQDCRWIEFGEGLIAGDGVEIIADGVDELKVYVGPNTVFARGVYLRSANHRFDDFNSPMLAQGHASKRVLYRERYYSVVIEGNCWIGANAIILSGAHICEGAVIGAGAVVTGTVPRRSVVAGSPARVIKNLDNRI